MTKVWAGMSAAVFMALGVGLAAQASGQNPSQSPSSSSPGRIMVTGCVQPAAAGPTGTSGTAASAIGETKFHLTNATLGTTGPQGAGSASTSTAKASTYRLDGDDAKLKPHVGQKVEISGTIAPASATPSSADASPSAKAPQLKVDTVKMVASTCAE